MSDAMRRATKVCARLEKGTDMKKPRYATFRFSLSQIADFICEFTQDGERTENRDVVQWFDWFERRCGVRKSHIFSLRARAARRKVVKR